MGTHLLSLRVRDDAGKAGNIKVFVPDSVTIAQLETYAIAFAEAADSVTGAKIEAASARMNLDISSASLKATAIADHPVQWGAIIGYSAAGTPYRHTQLIPAVDQGLVDAGDFDVGDALVTALTALMVTGNGTVVPSDEYENDLTAVLGGEVTFRKA
jgi:hypothetical protein